nr:hypothetical protein [Candidatus Sigynarchaeota archaeon]
MKILLINIDSKIPSMPLRKIGGFYKDRGDQVFYDNGCRNPDYVYISCVFSKNAATARGIAKMFSCPTALGGYGVNNVQLPDEIEHHMPDYAGMDFSFGYTSRGCFRNCPWCIVPKMEGKLRDHASITEFLHPDHKKLVLFDNNFLASPRWRENLRFIIAHNLKICFNQGLDIRLINEENAGMLADCKYSSLSFKKRRLYFAFDHPSIEREFCEGIQRLKNAGISTKNIMVYMLCGFGVSATNYNFATDWNRYKIIRDLGADPYVMKYDGRRDIRVLNHFARWVIRRDYKRRRPKFLRPREWEELQEAINHVECEMR